MTTYSSISSCLELTFRLGAWAFVSMSGSPSCLLRPKPDSDRCNHDGSSWGPPVDTRERFAPVG
eukprot:CAMPEP_0181230192 /NCGR_PEP_ID=MMETSP1096-20121128/34328_1 /TAXON_ID=156174 ORGANISM="Chrysochromulina ericina, Strain CCMP281" /NCGR_SAMPLE_ID=MMETSP1096 /ASSEMBLY_ACC=CAM_ASM_000453 /LENGTH=63 /DNA_ID=CAMNT_0023323923 /DNA_START=352 /DNA_END=539 /DNA_ORIENTATION=+